VDPLGESGLGESGTVLGEDARQSAACIGGGDAPTLIIMGYWV